MRCCGVDFDDLHREVPAYTDRNLNAGSSAILVPNHILDWLPRLREGSLDALVGW
jgi:hypothetical protein